MADAAELKRMKAKQLRYKKPIAKNLNLYFIKQDLYDIQEACEEVRWYTDSEDGSDSLLDALDDEDETYKFKMCFADLCAECEKMREDLEEEWVPDCFDIFFVATSCNNDEMLGFDSFEGDYYGIGFSDHLLRDDARKKIKAMKKDNLLDAAMQCMNIYKSYIGLRNRYDSLKCAIDVLKEQNKGHLEVVREIEKLYERVSKDKYSSDEWSRESREWKRYTDSLPQEAWIA